MKIHLGCGKAVFKDWKNIDMIDFPGVVKQDLRKPLDHKDNSVDFIFSEHFFEHLTRPEGVKLFKECYRVLKPGGVIRTTMPSLATLVQKYLEKDIKYWVPSWHPKTPCDLLNEGLRAWEHRYVYDLNEITLALQEAGFRKIVEASYRKSSHLELCNLEIRKDHKELIVEATK